MATIKDPVTGNIYEADVVIEDFVMSKKVAERKALRDEYLFGKDMSAWVQVMCTKYGILTPDGNPVTEVKS